VFETSFLQSARPTLQDIESSKKEAPYGKSRGASFLLK
jgi:hypothetical protein